jgi:hypothetical protein
MMLYYIEPCLDMGSSNHGHSICFVSKQVAIAQGRLAHGQLPDDVLLADFATVHLAEDVSVLVEKMAKGMWEQFVSLHTKTPAFDHPNNVWPTTPDSEWWRDRARAALKAMGVDLP